MFRKIIFSAVALLISLSSFSQAGNSKMQKPDFKEIEKAIKDKASPFFYTNLMKRYTDDDTTLTTQEYRYLYYGFSFQKNYSPYGKSSYSDALKKKPY